MELLVNIIGWSSKHSGIIKFENQTFGLHHTSIVMVIDSVHPLSVGYNVTSWNPQSLNIYCGVVSEEFVLFTDCPVPIPYPSSTLQLELKDVFLVQIHLQRMLHL